MPNPISRRAFLAAAAAALCLLAALAWVGVSHNPLQASSAILPSKPTASNVGLDQYVQQMSAILKKQKEGEVTEFFNRSMENLKGIPDRLLVEIDSSLLKPEIPEHALRIQSQYKKTYIMGYNPHLVEQTNPPDVVMFAKRSSDGRIFAAVMDGYDGLLNNIDDEEYSIWIQSLQPDEIARLFEGTAYQSSHNNSRLTELPASSIISVPKVLEQDNRFLINFPVWEHPQTDNQARFQRGTDFLINHAGGPIDVCLEGCQATNEVLVQIIDPADGRVISEQISSETSGRACFYLDAGPYRIVLTPVNSGLDDYEIFHDPQLLFIGGLSGKEVAVQTYAVKKPVIEGQYPSEVPEGSDFSVGLTLDNRSQFDLAPVLRLDVISRNAIILAPEPRPGEPFSLTHRVPLSRELYLNPTVFGDASVATLPVSLASVPAQESADIDLQVSLIDFADIVAQASIHVIPANATPSPSPTCTAIPPTLTATATPTPTATATARVWRALLPLITRPG